MKNHPILTAVGAILFCVVGLPTIDSLTSLIQTNLGLKIADGQIVQQKKQLEVNRIIYQIQQEEAEHQLKMANIEPTDTRIIGFEVPSQEEEEYVYETDRKN